MKDWETKKGELIKPQDMSWSHLGNSLRYFTKAWEEFCDDEITYMFDQEENSGLQRKDLLGRLKLLNKELKRRLKEEAER